MWIFIYIFMRLMELDYVIKEIDEIDFSYRWRKTRTLSILYVFAYYVYSMNSYIFQSS